MLTPTPSQAHLAHPTDRYRADFEQALETTTRTAPVALSSVRKAQLLAAMLKHPDARDILNDGAYAGMLLTDEPVITDRVYVNAAGQYAYDHFGFLLASGASWVAYRAVRPDGDDRAVYLGFFRLAE